MREAKITLPKRDHEGNYMIKEHNYIHDYVLSEWGGYTLTEGVGIWVDPETGNRYQDEVDMYHVAMDGTEKDNQNLTILALYLLAMSDQECIYLVQANGEVKFVNKGE